MKRKTVLLGIILFILASCSTIKITSQFAKHSPVIDGKHKDWKNSHDILDNQTLYADIKNDDSFLYISLITGDPNIKRQLRRGLIVWIDSEANKDKRFGIKFPVREFNEQRNDKSKQKNRQMRNPPNHSDIEIYNEDSKRFIQYSIHEVNPIEIKLKSSFSELIYELKIPLKETENAPFAIDVKDFSDISVGFETFKPKMNKKMMGQRGTRKGGSGGMKQGRGPGRSGSRSGGGRGMNHMNSDRPEPISVWTLVTLAKK